MSQQPLFLDTTVFADRQFGRKRTRAEIDEILGAARARTARYVREQFRATFLRAAVLLHNSLRDTRDPGETLADTDDYRVFQTGMGVKARKILCGLISGAGDVDDKLATLELLIEFDMMRRFDELAELDDTTACCLCVGEPTRDHNGFFQFEKRCSLSDPRPCSIEDFWKSNNAELTNLATTQDADVPAAAKSAAQKACSGERPRGRRCFVDLSDSVITTEAPKASAILTSNLRDFVPLARVLGRGQVRGYQN